MVLTPLVDSCFVGKGIYFLLNIKLYSNPLNYFWISGGTAIDRNGKVYMNITVASKPCVSPMNQFCGVNFKYSNAYT